MMLPCHLLHFYNLYDPQMIFPSLLPPLHCNLAPPNKIVLATAIASTHHAKTSKPSRGRWAHKPTGPWNRWYHPHSWWAGNNCTAHSCHLHHGSSTTKSKGEKWAQIAYPPLYKFPVRGVSHDLRGMDSLHVPRTLGGTHELLHPEGHQGPCLLWPWPAILPCLSIWDAHQGQW